MRSAKQILAPRTQEIPITVKHHHWVVAPIKHVNLVLAVDSHRCDIHEPPAFRQLGPIIPSPVSKFSRTEYSRHVFLTQLDVLKPIPRTLIETIYRSLKTWGIFHGFTIGILWSQNWQPANNKMVD
tara:strand:- start:427 stop:804 length:378 start_codon:yes stop_codon:yes gene_type:complete